MITLEQVKQELDSEEPRYLDIARGFNGDALDHLLTLASDRDPMLASKAVYLASMIPDRRSATVLMKAAQSPQRVVRVAAASGVRNLPANERSDLLLALLDDDDAGVRRVALKSFTSEVRIIQLDGEGSRLLTERVEALYDEIRQRAFQLFQSRGCVAGFDQKDWYQAESSLIFAPRAEFAEEDNLFSIVIDISAGEPWYIRVNVLPRAIIVEGKSFKALGKQDFKATPSQYSHQTLLWNVELPQRVSPCTVSATIRDGVLRITVGKAVISVEELSISIAARV